MIVKGHHQYKFIFWQQWLIHAMLVWLIINGSDTLTFWYQVQSNGSYLFHTDGSPVTVWERFTNHNVHQAIGVVILFVTLLIELSYHYAFRRKKLRTFIIVCLCTGAFSRLFIALFNHWKFGLPVRDVDFSSILIITAYTFTYALVRDLIFQRVQRAEKRYEHSKAELAALKAHLHPHFFFNTLNNLYGIAMQEQATRTAEGIDRLSGLMRYVMTESKKDFTTVDNEIQFLKDYLQLQRLRLPQKENIQLEINIQYDGEPAQIAPLLLVPFVENAFRYGISMDLECFVHLQVIVTRRQLAMVVENRILPLRHIEKGGGTGIENSRKRLCVLYPDKHDLTIDEMHDTFKVRLQVLLD